MKALDPSSRAPSAPGPKTSLSSARSLSASPSTSGCSGPMTKRSAAMASAGLSVTLMAKPSAEVPAIPGFPGVTTTSAVRARARARACSRPPEPTTQTFTVSPSIERSPSIGGHLQSGGPHAAKRTNWSRPGPTPTSLIGTPIWVARKEMYCRAAGGRSPSSVAPERSSCQPGSSS